MEDKGFEIRCLNCGSINVTIEEDWLEDENYDGEFTLGFMGTYFYCHDCGQSDR